MMDVLEQIADAQAKGDKVKRAYAHVEKVPEVTVPIVPQCTDLKQTSSSSTIEHTSSDPSHLAKLFRCNGENPHEEDVLLRLK